MCVYISEIRKTVSRVSLIKHRNTHKADVISRRACAIRSRLLDQSFRDGSEIMRIGEGVLRMPLHPDHPRGRMLDGLDHAITSPRDDREAIRHIPYGLMVSGPHRDLGSTQNATKLRVGVNIYLLRHHDRM